MPPAMQRSGRVAACVTRSEADGVPFIILWTPSKPKTLLETRMQRLLTSSMWNTVIPIVTTLIALVVLIVYSAKLVRRVREESFSSAEPLSRVVAVVIAAWALLYVPVLNVIMAIAVAVLVTPHADGGATSGPEVETPGMWG